MPQIPAEMEVRLNRSGRFHFEQNRLQCFLELRMTDHSIRIEIGLLRATILEIEFPLLL